MSRASPVARTIQYIFGETVWEKPFTPITASFPSVGNPYAKYNLRTILIPWQVPTANYKTLPTHCKCIWKGDHHWEEHVTTINNGKAEIEMNGVQLKEVISFSYFKANFFSKMGAAQQKSASGSIQQQQLDSIWWSRTIRFSIKYRPYNSLVAPIMHYRCQMWNLLTDREENTDTGTKCLRKLLRIP